MLHAMKRLALFFCILLTWLFASHSSAQTTFQDDRGWLEFQDEVNELIFQAYTFPEDSYELGGINDLEKLRNPIE